MNGVQSKVEFMIAWLDTIEDLSIHPMRREQIQGMLKGIKGIIALVNKDSEEFRILDEEYKTATQRLQYISNLANEIAIATDCEPEMVDIVVGPSNPNAAKLNG